MFEPCDSPHHPPHHLLKRMTPLDRAFVGGTRDLVEDLVEDLADRLLPICTSQIRCQFAYRKSGYHSRCLVKFPLRPGNWSKGSYKTLVHIQTTIQFRTSLRSAIDSIFFFWFIAKRERIAKEGNCSVIRFHLLLIVRDSAEENVFQIELDSLSLVHQFILMLDRPSSQAILRRYSRGFS